MSAHTVDLDRGVVLVTDISRDYGVRVATEFLAAGWNVAVTARCVTELIGIVAGKPAHRFFAIVADPTDRWQADRILDRVTVRFGTINRIVDPAGVVTSAWNRQENVDAVA